MKEENLELTKEEFEDIEWKKAGFTQAEIEEMDRRAANIENAIPWEDFLKELELYCHNQNEILEPDQYFEKTGEIPYFTTDEILKSFGL